MEERNLGKSGHRGTEIIEGQWAQKEVRHKRKVGMVGQ